MPGNCGFAHRAIRWQNYSQENAKSSRQGCTGGYNGEFTGAPGVVGPFAGLDVPWLLRMRAETRRDHPFLIWAPFEARRGAGATANFTTGSARSPRASSRAASSPANIVLIHLDNCIEAMLAWFACVELGAIAVTTNTRSAPAEMEYFADHCGAVAAITQPAYAELISATLPRTCAGSR